MKSGPGFRAGSGSCVATMRARSSGTKTVRSSSSGVASRRLDGLFHRIRRHPLRADLKTARIVTTSGTQPARSNVAMGTENPRPVLACEVRGSDARPAFSGCFPGAFGRLLVCVFEAWRKRGFVFLEPRIGDFASVRARRFSSNGVPEVACLWRRRQNVDSGSPGQDLPQHRPAGSRVFASRDRGDRCLCGA
jgi:hypothetical protein